LTTEQQRGVPAMRTVKRLWLMFHFSFFERRAKGDTAMNVGEPGGFCSPGWRG
jgi:hypothetical protein